MRALSKQSHVREREMKVGYREVFDLKSHPGWRGQDFMDGPGSHYYPSLLSFPASGILALEIEVQME